MYKVKVEIDRLIKDRWEDLLKNYKGKSRDKVGLALHWLRENYIKLFYSYNLLKKVENDLASIKESQMGEELHYRQIAFVQKIENFHQQVYATLSSLIAAVNYLGIKGVDGKDHPIHSVEKFLKYLEAKFPYRGVLKDNIFILQKSIDYRSRFVDHLQQHILHEWMTYDYEDQCYVIYFQRKGDEVYPLRGNVNPLSSDFVPCVNCGDDFYVSPDKDTTYMAVIKVAKVILGL